MCHHLVHPLTLPSSPQKGKRPTRTGRRTPARLQDGVPAEKAPTGDRPPAKKRRASKVAHESPPPTESGNASVPDDERVDADSDPPPDLDREDGFSDVSPTSDGPDNAQSNGSQASSRLPTPMTRALAITTTSGADAVDDSGPTAMQTTAPAPPGIPYFNPLTLPTHVAPPLHIGPAPGAMMTSGAPLDAWLDPKVKEAIWAGAYVTISTLSGEPPESMGIRVAADGALSFTPAKKPMLRTFDQWLKGFLVYMTVYLQQRPEDTSRIFKHVDTVRDLHANGGRWEFYDESVRRLRTSIQWPWDQVHMEFWGRAMTLYATPRDQLPEQQGRSSRRDGGGPQSTRARGPCYAFNKGRSCYRDCEYPHVCASCGGKHARLDCTNGAKGGSVKGPRRRPARNQQQRSGWDAAQMPPAEQRQIQPWQQPFRQGPPGDANRRK